MPEKLKQAVRALANMRRDYDKVHAEYVEAQKVAYETYKHLAHLDEAAKSARADAEAEARELQLAHPTWCVDGVEVVNGSEMPEYSETVAVAWAVDHNLPQILRLDKKAYEAVALSLGILQKHEVLKTRIASDLSGYLND